MSYHIEPAPEDGASPEPSAAPVPKVVAATAAAAAATLIMVVIQLVTDAELPVGLEGAITVVLAFLGGYFKRPQGVA